ncbi:hypothetical protein TWF281_008460 [Arthrobotrys megalospora]
MEKQEAAAQSKSNCSRTPSPPPPPIAPTYVTQSIIAAKRNREDSPAAAKTMQKTIRLSKTKSSKIQYVATHPASLSATYIAQAIISSKRKRETEPVATELKQKDGSNLQVTKERTSTPTRPAKRLRRTRATNPTKLEKGKAELDQHENPPARCRSPSSLGLRKNHQRGGESIAADVVTNTANYVVANTTTDIATGTAVDTANDTANDTASDAAVDVVEGSSLCLWLLYFLILLFSAFCFEFYL